MSQFYKDLSVKIIENVRYETAEKELFQAYIFKLSNEKYEISKSTIKKLTLTLQYFYLSECPKYVKEGSILMSMLLFVCGEEIIELTAVADSVYSQKGDFPNVELLKRRFKKYDLKINIFDEARKEIRREINKVEEIDHVLTDYQRSLWEDLSSDNDLITSAPTSTGKTYLILQYLVHKLSTSDGAFAAIVVPTRALIAELASKVYEISKNMSIEKEIEICTVPKEGPFKAKTFFVMTQERMFEILQSGDLYFNYLFIDEAHNISDKSRGVLLHLTLQKMLDWSNPQIIISMPSARYINAFNSIFKGVEFTKNVTTHSPVAKILMPVELKGRNIFISRLNTNNKICIPKNFKGSDEGSEFAKIVFRLGQGESNIVYRNRTDYCENAARDLAKLVLDEKSSLPLGEAADYVEQFIHEDFTLASCLRKGVAFHYGPLPGAIRTMIEALAREGEVDYVVCTSTLAEGVNLPAKNLFLSNPTQPIPMQPSERLEDVTLNNITGRAGRMLEHFSGNVFLVEPEKWTFTDYFDENDDEADMIPTYFRLLNENCDKVISALTGSYEHTEDDQYSYYTIANKLLKEYDTNLLEATLDADELTLSDRDKNRLEMFIREAYEGLKVDTFTLEGNPTVGFIQQNKLYKKLSSYKDFNEWTLPHPMSSALYPTLVKVCTLLEEVGIFIPKETFSIEFSCLIAKKWMIGDSLKSIIVDQIKHDKKRGEEYNCNRSVRTVIKVINNDIRFRMSSALRCYHSILSGMLGEKQIEMQSTKIHSFIETGCCGDRAINLSNFGLSRETALEIDSLLKRGSSIKSVQHLREVYNRGLLDELHAVSKREIVDLLM